MPKTTEQKAKSLSPPQQAPVARQGQVAKDDSSTVASEPLAPFFAPSCWCRCWPFAGDGAE
jgi:hypothetical protein